MKTDREPLTAYQVNVRHVFPDACHEMHISKLTNVVVAKSRTSKLGQLAFIATGGIRKPRETKMALAVPDSRDVPSVEEMLKGQGAKYKPINL